MTLALRILLLTLLLCGCSGAPPAEPGDAAGKVYVLLEFLQQSNGTGTDHTNAPAGLPDAGIPFWVNDFSYHDGPQLFEPLNVRTLRGGSFSHELRTAQRLRDAGLQVAAIKLTKGASFISRWLPGRALGDEALAELALAWSVLPEQFPIGTKFHPLWVTDQGEAEARYFDQPSVEKWSGYFLQVQTEVEVIVGEPLSPYVVRTCSTIHGKTFPGVLEAQQASVVLEPSHLIPTDDLEFRSDGVHRTGASQNILGDRIADAMLSAIERGRE